MVDGDDKYNIIKIQELEENIKKKINPAISCLEVGFLQTMPHNMPLKSMRIIQQQPWGMSLRMSKSSFRV